MEALSKIFTYTNNEGKFECRHYYDCVLKQDIGKFKKDSYVDTIMVDLQHSEIVLVIGENDYVYTLEVNINIL